jgi:hypothetical protein
MRVAGALLLAVVVGGCTSVRIVQREGCWVKHTEKWPNRVTEEIGPCERQAPTWSDDRLTRLVQECVAQADYRWQNRALAAWSRGEPLPQVELDENVLQTCMNEAANTMITENEALKARLGEVSTDRETLRAQMEEASEHLRASHNRVTDALGEAANKPPGSAVATATSTSTSDGSATTQSDSTSEAPLAVDVLPMPVPSRPPATIPAPKPTKARVLKTPAEAPKPEACELRPKPGQPEVTEALAPKPGTPSLFEPATMSIEPERPKTEPPVPASGD